MKIEIFLKLQFFVSRDFCLSGFLFIEVSVRRDFRSSTLLTVDVSPLFRCYWPSKFTTVEIQFRRFCLSRFSPFEIIIIWVPKKHILKSSAKLATWKFILYFHIVVRDMLVLFSVHRTVHGVGNALFKQIISSTNTRTAKFQKGWFCDSSKLKTYNILSRPLGCTQNTRRIAFLDIYGNTLL